jgi:serine/threonine protein kinase
MIQPKEYLKINPKLSIKNNFFKIKIINFDHSQQIVAGKLSTYYYGTPGYISPEILLQTPYSLEKNMVWQLGATLYKLYFSDVPFNDNELPFDNNNNGLQLDIGVGMKEDMEINNTNRLYFSDEIVRFLSKMVEKDPVDRQSIFQVAAFNWY